MSNTFHDDTWGTVLPALDLTDAASVRKHQVRAVGWGARVGYSTDEQRNLLEMLGLVDYRAVERPIR